METYGVNIMNNIKPFTFYDFISIVGCLGFIIVLYFAIPPDKYNFYDYLKSKRPESYNQKQKDKPPLITCIYCQGTGERVEDVNKLMFMAKVQLYFNKHMMVDKCEKCVKLPNGEYDYCDKVKEKHESFLRDYEKEGLKFEKTMCGKCMGAGQFQMLSKNLKTNQWYTQEDYEKDELAKTNEK
jgi:hypothetical protein